MKYYLAARYERRLEMVEYAAKLRLLGHEITSRWIDGGHEPSEPRADWQVGLEEQYWATADLSDVRACDALIAFTEEPDSPHGRGGRHVEYGYAMGLGKALILIGPRENIFHHLFLKNWWFSDFAEYSSVVTRVRAAADTGLDVRARNSRIAGKKSRV